MCVVMASEATVEVLELRMVCRFPLQIVPANTPAVHPFGARLRAGRPGGGACSRIGCHRPVGPAARGVGTVGSDDRPGLPDGVWAVSRPLSAVFRRAANRRRNQLLSVVRNRL